METDSTFCSWNRDSKNRSDDISSGGSLAQINWQRATGLGGGGSAGPVPTGARPKGRLLTLLPELQHGGAAGSTRRSQSSLRCDGTAGPRSGMKARNRGRWEGEKRCLCCQRENQV